jgi:hypothetical protein
MATIIDLNLVVPDQDFRRSAASIPLAVFSEICITQQITKHRRRLPRQDVGTPEEGLQRAS